MAVKAAGRVAFWISKGEVYCDLWFPVSMSALQLWKRISQSITNADYEMFWRQERTVLPQFRLGVLFYFDGCFESCNYILLCDCI